jgi:hypothetical protein
MVFYPIFVTYLWGGINMAVSAYLDFDLISGNPYRLELSLRTDAEGLTKIRLAQVFEDGGSRSDTDARPISNSPEEIIRAFRSALDSMERELTPPVPASVRPV